MTNNSRGSAALEAIPVGAVLVLFIGGLLLSAYLIFGRAWIQYRSEQALYCLAEGRSAPTCQSELTSRLKQFLPFGDFIVSTAIRADQWLVETKWVYRDYKFDFKKEMTRASLFKAKRGLPW